jgi:hypothetical protein
LAQSNGHHIARTVLAYGRADLGSILAAHPTAKLSLVKHLLGAAASLLLRAIGPTLHLAHLSGRFLLSGGSNDRPIPGPSTELMRALRPEPKSVVLLGGEHIGTEARQRAQMEDIVRTTGTWLVEQGGVNAP